MLGASPATSQVFILRLVSKDVNNLVDVEQLRRNAAAHPQAHPCPTTASTTTTEGSQKCCLGRVNVVGREELLQRPWEVPPETSALRRSIQH